MSTWSRRRRRAAATAAVDWRGVSIPRDLPTRGEPEYRSTSDDVPPRPEVHRLQRLASLASSDPLTRLRGMGGEPAPHASSRKRQPGAVRTGPRLLVGARLLHPPFASPSDVRRLRSFWSEFNRLRVRLPGKVAFCVRRKQRRSVLFALGIGGKRGLRGRGGSYNRTANSLWGC